LVIIEWIGLTLLNKVENQRESWVNIFCAGLAFAPIFLLSKSVLLVIMFWCYENRFFDAGFEWYFWVLAWIIYDFSFWLMHLLSHKVRLLWCLHNVHHSAKEMKLSVGFRGSLFDLFLVPHTFLWLPLLGFHPFLVLFVDAIGKLYGVAVHINENALKDGKRRWYEWFLITPSAHRIHHSTNHLYLDTNYGEALAIWDRIFRTYQSEVKSDKPVYGVMKEIDSGDLIESQFSEFRSLFKDIGSTKSIASKLKNLIMPPGWNPNGNSIFAVTLRNEAIMELDKAKGRH